MKCSKTVHSSCFSSDSVEIFHYSRVTVVLQGIWCTTLYIFGVLRALHALQNKLKNNNNFSGVTPVTRVTRPEFVVATCNAYVTRTKWEENVKK